MRQRNYQKANDDYPINFNLEDLSDDESDDDVSLSMVIVSPFNQFFLFLGFCFFSLYL